MARYQILTGRKSAQASGQALAAALWRRLAGAAVVVTVAAAAEAGTLAVARGMPEVCLLSELH